MFKFYMMDKFISFMDIDGWNIDSYDDVREMKKVEPRWIPNNALLELSHGIRRKGALSCVDCHRSGGVLNFKGLGYTEKEIKSLESVRL